MKTIRINKSEISILKDILDYHINRVDDETWVNDYGNRTNIHVVSFLKKIGIDLSEKREV